MSGGSGKAAAKAALGVAGLVTFAVVMAVFSPWGIDQFTDAYVLGMDKLAACPRVVEVLGENPHKTWGLNNFEIGSSGSTGTARYRVHIRGSRRTGEYQFTASRTFETWMLTSARLLVPKTEQIVDVMVCRLDLAPDASIEQRFALMCEQNDSSGCLSLALLYRDGTYGVAKDASKAQTFGQRACKLGNQSGCMLFPENQPEP